MHRKIYYYLAEIREALETGWTLPITCEIDPSNNCMLNCKFCMYAEYLKVSNHNLDFDVYLNLINHLREIGTKSVTFTGGGEPLMHPQFNSMSKLAHLFGMQIGLVTNGVLLNKVDTENFLFIRVSLDASNPQMYHALKGKNLFDRVLRNIGKLVESGRTVGISYVVCEENKDGIEDMILLGERLGVKYVQFKPAWINGTPFKNYTVPNTKNIIDMQRYMARDRLPCTIAALIGVVGADANCYFCCQYRGDKRFCLGSLKHSSFSRLWEKRAKFKPDISSCPQCRYMNYAQAYKKAMEGETLFLEHKNFL